MHASGACPPPLLPGDQGLTQIHHLVVDLVILVEVVVVHQVVDLFLVVMMNALHWFINVCEWFVDVHLMLGIVTGQSWVLPTASKQEQTPEHIEHDPDSMTTLHRTMANVKFVPPTCPKCKLHPSKS